jgi:hypothetical protein
LQTIDKKALSRGIIGKSAPILADITIRKSQYIFMIFSKMQVLSSETALFGISSMGFTLLSDSPGDMKTSYGLQRTMNTRLT